MLLAEDPFGIALTNIDPEEVPPADDGTASPDWAVSQFVNLSHQSVRKQFGTVSLPDDGSSRPAKKAKVEAEVDARAWDPTDLDAMFRTT